MYSGRLGAVRFKSRLSDVTAIVGHMPVEPTTERSRRISSDVWRTLSAYVAALSSQTVPVLLVGTTAHLGVEVVAWSQGSVEAFTDLPALGNLGRQLENFNGGHLRQLLVQHKLCAPASFYPTGATFYSGRGDSVSNIDQVLVPIDFLASGVSAAVLLHEGDRLQMVPCTARRDHRPLSVVTYPHHGGCSARDVDQRPLWRRCALRRRLFQLLMKMYDGFLVFFVEPRLELVCLDGRSPLLLAGARLASPSSARSRSACARRASALAWRPPCSSQCVSSTLSPTSGTTSW